MLLYFASGASPRHTNRVSTLIDFHAGEQVRLLIRLLKLHAVSKSTFSGKRRLGYGRYLSHYSVNS